MAFRGLDFYIGLLEHIKLRTKTFPINGSDMLSYSLTTMMCFLIKE